MVLTMIMGVFGALIVCLLIFAGAVCWLQSEEDKYLKDDESKERKEHGGDDI